MKFNFHLPAIAIACTLFTTTGAYATTCTTTAAGNWSDPLIWSCGQVPANGDDVVISNNVNVDANSNALNSVTVNNSSTLTFTGGVKINMLNANSLFKIMGGSLITGGNGGTKIAYPTPGVSISGPFNQGGPATTNGSGTFTPGTPLPLTLLSFTAVKQEGKITTWWQTAQEKNIASFVIERSADGKTYNAVSETIAPANTTAQHDYSWTDAHPAAGTSYYRIRIAELDGTSELSGTAVINTNTRNTATLFPSPAHDKLNIGFSTLQAGSSVSVEIADMTGRELFRSSVANPMLQVNISEWQPGIYIARVVVDGTATVYRFIKS